MNRTRAVLEAQRGHTDATWPRELLMLRELADMIYQKHDTALAQVCAEAGIEFDQDSPSKLKVNLAPYPQKERIKALIAHLAQTKILGGYEDYVMQLLINEGIDGSSAAAEQLTLIQRDPKKYNSAAIGGLFRVIEGVGDISQVAVVEAFLKYEVFGVPHYANLALQNLNRGMPQRRMSVY